MIRKNFLLIISLLLISSWTINAQDFDYVGAKKCKMCHNKPAKGAQYKSWSEGPHANAMKTLSSEAALAIAKKKGIENPATDPSCIKCHSTVGGTNPDLHTATITIDEGVSCESCHGPGSAYKSKTIMSDQAKSIENGLIVPTEKLCITCHNAESPTFKGFNFEEYLAKISHKDPTL